MSETSVSQQNFLQKKRQHKRIVHSSRFLILILFLGIWEFTASKGFIDSFIFSSPSKVAACFWSMVCDKSYFSAHHSHTLRDTCQLFSRHFVQSSCDNSFMVQSKTLRNIRTVSCRFKQSAKICACTTFNCVAWCNSHYNHCRRHVCRNFWKHPEPIHNIYQR